MAKILVLSGISHSLQNFRGDLLKQLRSLGHDVIACAGDSTPRHVQFVEGLGAEFREYPLQRTGLNPLQDMRTWLALRRMIRDVNPDVILAYTIKPVIWGGLALPKRSQARLVSLITGVGYAMQSEGASHRKLLAKLVQSLYRKALNRAGVVVFQNPDNRALFVDSGLVAQDKAQLVAGSGVNLSVFQAPAPVYSDERGVVFITIARLLKSKGLYEFEEAAREVKRNYPASRFVVVGPSDPSPDGIPAETVREWASKGVLELAGEVTDVRPALASADVFVLASHHEGVPRSTLEAMGMSRAVITTDAPGCKETVMDGVNGFQFRTGSASELARLMARFIEEPGLLTRMGKASRELAEARFDVDKVNKDLIALMGLPCA